MITFKKSVTRQQVVLVLLIVSPPAVQQSINISCTPGPQQQTLCSGMQQSSGTDRQMDRQTDRQTDRRMHESEHCQQNSKWSHQIVCCW